MLGSAVVAPRRTGRLQWSSRGWVSPCCRAIWQPNFSLPWPHWAQLCLICLYGLLRIPQEHLKETQESRVHSPQSPYHWSGDTLQSLQGQTSCCSVLPPSLCDPNQTHAATLQGGVLQQGVTATPSQVPPSDFSTTVSTPWRSN